MIASTQDDVRTEHVSPPIPIRIFDWLAYDKHWDGDPETAKSYAWGHGKTEAEAIADFWADMEARGFK